MLSGDNGILQKSTDAKTYTNNSQIQERINLAYHSSLVDGQGKVTEPSLEDEIKKEFNKTTLEEGWLDKTSKAGKWIITIDNVSLEIPAGVDVQNSPLNILIGKTKKDIVFNSIIQIDNTTNAKFYDSDFNTCDDYIEYDGKIYKVSYDLDYSSISNINWNTSEQNPGSVLSYPMEESIYFWGDQYPFENLEVNSIVQTDFEISELGENGNTIVTITHGTKNWMENDPIKGIPSYLFDDNIGTLTFAFAYASDGTLVDYPMYGNITSWYWDTGWIAHFEK